MIKFFGLEEGFEACQCNLLQLNVGVALVHMLLDVSNHLLPPCLPGEMGAEVEVLL
jgi:hypothetical protein